MKEKIDFNDYAADYNNILKQQLQFFDADNTYFAEYKIIKTKQVLKNSPMKILDFGCGVGKSIPFFEKHFPLAHISGCDISEKSLAIAAKQYPEGNYYKTKTLLASKNRFDLIFLSGVLHHIDIHERKSLFRALKSLLMTNASIVIFEHNPFNPVTRHMVNTCPFDRDATLLRPSEIKTLLADAGLKTIRCDFTLFFPDKLKKLRPLEHYLRFIPLGGQYMVQGIIK